MITGLELLFLEVNNLEESLSFYHDQLGFEIESHTPEAEPPMAAVRAGSLRATLVQQLETMLKRGRGVHFVLGVGDVDQFYERLRMSQVQVSEPRDEGWGGRFVSLQDPDGYRLFFVTWDRGICIQQTIHKSKIVEDLIARGYGINTA
jgi:catechol 2,3-dioxygenase-like lactoylglutathione lyase family enzyme